MNLKQCNSANYKKGRIENIRYIVVHYTAGKNDTALGNATYFARAATRASAHYFVDSGEVWQSVKDGDTAWHCGGGLQGKDGHAFFGKCKNANSIGVELCSYVGTDGKYHIKQETADNAAKLVRELMERYDVNSDHVVRHYDVTGKNCPAPWVAEQQLWENFKEKLEDDMTEERVREIIAEKMVYNYIDDNMPPWAQPTIRKLVDRGCLQGDEQGRLNLTDELLRMLVINDRAGVYGK